MAEVIDISPPTEPISIARDMVSQAPSCVAGVYVLVRKDGKFISDSCGHHTADVLWALQRMIFDLMQDET